MFSQAYRKCHKSEAMSPLSDHSITLKPLFMQKFGGPYSLELIDLEGDHFNLKWKTENNFFIFPPLQRGRKSIRIKLRFYRWVEDTPSYGWGNINLPATFYLVPPFTPFGEGPLLTGLLLPEKRVLLSPSALANLLGSSLCSPLFATRMRPTFFLP